MTEVSSILPSLEFSTYQNESGSGNDRHHDGTALAERHRVDLHESCRGVSESGSEGRTTEITLGCGEAVQDIVWRYAEEPQEGREERKDGGRGGRRDDATSRRQAEGPGISSVFR